MTERIELPNEEKIRMFGEKKLQILGNIGSGHHQTSVDERKKFKVYLRRTTKLLETNNIAENLIKGIKA